jgi:Malectin domain/Putative collagen-binding domain of a collagenase
MHQKTKSSAGRMLGRPGPNRLAAATAVACVVALTFGLVSVASGSPPASLRARLASTANTAITSPLRVSMANSHFLTDGSGRAVYLSGSHTWDNMQDLGNGGSPAPFDFNSYVNFLVAHGQNMTILWRKDLPTFCNWGAGGTWHASPFPWLRTGPAASDGLPAFDLSRFDQSYFDRLRARVVQLGQNNIYATVQLFDGLDLLNNRCAGDGYPFSGGNNVNGVDDGGGIGSMTMNAANAVTNFEDAFVKKVIDTVGDQPNVLWEISEEAPSNSTWWQNHMISLIHSYEATKPMQHPVGYPGLTGGSDSTLYASAADWVAPAARISPSTNSGNKAIVNDSDHSYFGMWNDSAQTNRNYLWENFTKGSSVVFMDPYEIYWSSGNRNLCPGVVNGVCNGVDSRWDNFRNNLGYAVAYANKMNLAAMTPQSNRSSTGWALANTATTGSEFLIYAPTGGSFTVDLSNTTKTLNAEWLNPSTGATTPAGTINGGSTSQNFTPPFGGDAVLHLWDAGSTTATTTTTTPATTTAVRVTTGSSYTDSTGKLWSAASGFSTANSYAVSTAILGTPDQRLYQTERWGKTFNYTTSVPNGNYDVTLKFAEVYWNAPGQRVFNVAINGTAVLTRFDILTQTAPFTALDKTFPITVTNGVVTISFTTVADNAKVNALSIVSR